MSSYPSGCDHIAIVGGGSWGTAVARRVGLNLLDGTTAYPATFVKLWMVDEVLEGRSLVDIVSMDHENPKYLPGVKIPHNVVATSNLADCVQGAKVVLLVVPSQYLQATLRNMKSHTDEDAVCVSLVKGVDFSGGELKRFSQMIEESLAVRNVAVMMGANLASDVARDNYAETTVACHDRSIARKISTLFACDTFAVETTDDVATVELLGALKNVIALGAGFCDGLGYGSSTKAAIIRKGLEEMELFCQNFGDSPRYKPHTLLGACGVADLVATSYSGRNRKCAAEFATYRLRTASRSLRPEDVKDLWAIIESEVLSGQKLQGVTACKEVMQFLQASGYLDRYPEHFALIRRIYNIACLGDAVETLVPQFNSADHTSQIRELP